MKADPSKPQTFKPDPAPTLPLMHAAFILAGLGTMLLGPILPLLSRHWHLTDAQSGLLPLAQFLGATLGGASTTRRLERGLLLGLLAAAAGFTLFAFAVAKPAPTFPLALSGLLLGGFGVGRTIATINILAGARYTLHRGSALSWLNFSWSFGALLSPLSAAWLATRVPLATLLTLFAAFFLVCAAAFTLQLRRASITSPKASSTADPTLPRTIFLYFAALILLYGGLETSLSVWLTTFALRQSQSSLALSQYTLLLLLCGLTAGRALAAWLLRHMRESPLQRLALVLSTLLAAALALAHTAPAIALFAILLGLTLAPIFPTTFALLMERKPAASQAGIALAASGIGAALLPALMGLLSTRTGSLQLALTLPIAAALAMLLLTLTPPAKVPA